MNRLIRFAVVFLCFVSSAFADNIVDIVGRDVSTTQDSLATTINFFSFQYDVTTNTVLTNPVIMGPYSTFQFGPSFGGSLFTLFGCVPPVAGCDREILFNFGPNDRVGPLPPADLAFPAVGTYSGFVLSGFTTDGTPPIGDWQYTSGTITVTEVPEPPVAILVLFGLAALVMAKALPRLR